jgi:hypothetical protein
MSLWFSYWKFAVMHVRSTTCILEYGDFETDSSCPFHLWFSLWLKIPVWKLQDKNPKHSKKSVKQYVIFIRSTYISHVGIHNFCGLIKVYIVCLRGVLFRSKYTDTFITHYVCMCVFVSVIYVIKKKGKGEASTVTECHKPPLGYLPCQLVVWSNNERTDQHFSNYVHTCHQRDASLKHKFYICCVTTQHGWYPKRVLLLVDMLVGAG